LAEDLRFDDAFRAHDLAVPMGHAYSVNAGEPAGAAKLRLLSERFDQAPVLDGSMPVGFVLARRLQDGSQQPVREVMTPLGTGNVVSADASVGRLLEWIIEPGLLFVLQGKEITGFITVWDFNKQPARGYLYLLLSRLETDFAELIRRRFPDQNDALSLLPDDSQPQVLGRYAPDEAADRESELLAYFDFSDLVEVIERDEQIRRALGFRSRNAWSRQIGGMVELRNAVMHPVRNMVLAKAGLIQLHRREQRIRSLIAAAESALEWA